MATRSEFSMFTMILLISFASVNAVLFTPALPAIADFFHVSMETSQLTITFFLVGYAIGQLIYSPLANRFGRKPALYCGIWLQIISSVLCVIAGDMQSMELLIIGRFLQALGSGVGLKMTFTLINERNEPKVASKKISYLMLSFAVTPGLAIALGGILNSHLGWQSCFYALACYGLILLYLVTKFPETHTQLDLHAFEFKHLVKGYSEQFKNLKLLSGGCLMGSCSSFIYVFAALGPFIAMNEFGMSSTDYGIANLLPPMGIFVGTIMSVQLIKIFKMRQVVFAGIVLAMIGTTWMTFMFYHHASVYGSIFIPLTLIYAGLAFVLGNASTLAMNTVYDKAHGSAVMNFLNISYATAMVLSIGYLPPLEFLLPMIFIGLSAVMLVLFPLLSRD